MSVEWVFDPAPPSGARRGGNAAEYGFEGRIDTLVREVVQNSMDAGNPWEEQVDVRFRFVELTGDYLAAFLETMSWSFLRDNLLAVPDGRGGKSIHSAMDEMEKKDRLLLLCIEDRGTAGLSGNEIRQSDDEINRFSALVRDELYSDKDSADAGGSYGLGKILLWAYSAFKTVLFSSVPKECPNDHSGLRFIGRTSLPYHETDADGPCAGAGWFGIPREVGNGRYAGSVWGQEGIKHAKKCYTGRKNEDYGLSTVIVGFEEPGQQTRKVEEIVESIQEATLESFWPALALKHVSISVMHERDGDVISEKEMLPDENVAYSELTSLLNGFHNGSVNEIERLENVGDSAFKYVPIEIPKRIADPDHAAFTGKVVLLVKLIEDQDEFDIVKDSIYRFRHPGMIVRHSGGKSLSISARPYVAAVLCGRACGDNEEEKRIEQFLRSAEPPEHDKWQPDTRAIKENYQTHGVKAKMSRFENIILRAVRELVSLPEKKGGSLPKELLKHLRFGESSGGGNPRFLTSTIDARVVDGVWNFSIKCRRTKPDDSSWHAVVRLKYAVDGGSADDIHAISAVTSPEASRIEIKKGDAYLEFPSDVTSAVIKGETSAESLPAIGTNAAVQIRVDGQKGEFENV